LKTKNLGGAKLNKKIKKIRGKILFLFFEKKKILVAWVGQGAWALTGSTPGLIDSCTYWNINGNDILMVWDAWQGIYYQDLDSFLVNGLIVVTKQLDNPFLLLHQ
jgi:hypothetical protein